MAARVLKHYPCTSGSQQILRLEYRMVIKGWHELQAQRYTTSASLQ